MGGRANKQREVEKSRGKERESEEKERREKQGATRRDAHTRMPQANNYNYENPKQ